MKQLVPITIMCLTSVGAMAQDQTLTGQVLDVAGRPVVGATVLEKGTNNGTDGSGRFTLRARSQSPTLVISSIGFAPQEVSAGAGPISVRGGVHHQPGCGAGGRLAQPEPLRHGFALAG